MNTDLKKRTKEFALDVIRFVQKLPNRQEYGVIGNQLLRSATSVGANTRSAFRARSEKEFKAKIGIVVEEADEAAYWLELLGEILKDHDNIKKIEKEAIELTKIFNSIKSKN